MALPSFLFYHSFTTSQMVSLHSHQLFTHINSSFAELANPTIAKGQEKYMKNKFVFYGLQMPTWRKQSRLFFTIHGPLNESDLVSLVQLCYQSPYRELHYFSLELIEKHLEELSPSFVSVFEYLTITNSWWDTIDWIAKLVGIHFKRFPNLIPSTTDHWMHSNQMWLQRVCLLFQLHYKQHTDQVLLFSFVTQLAHSKEFFIQKAAGWALRQYSKTNPAAVYAFVQLQALPTLTRKEALRLINNP